MKLAKGRYLPLSLPRRMVSDMLFAGQQLTLIPGERTMQLAEVVTARQAAWPKPSWLSLFIKAYANVAVRRPELRRVFLTWPWPRLFEYDETVVAISVEREWQGERVLLPCPHSVARTKIIAGNRRRPADLQRAACRIHLRFPRCPAPRQPSDVPAPLVLAAIDEQSATAAGQFLGTLGGSVTAGMGEIALSLITPWTLTFFYDAVEDDGSQVVRVMFDHRVCNGRVICSTLKEVERNSAARFVMSCWPWQKF